MSTEAWAIYCPDDYILIDTLQWTEADAKGLYSRQFAHNSWDVLAEEGFTCRPVTITEAEE